MRQVFYTRVLEMCVREVERIVEVCVLTYKQYGVQAT